ncbi:response regulator [Agromyces sp. GXQ0307]|uniref:response regulator n=1 Tax=Agromyces sp. GXQ0307 TaxID=3377835 RepID=UPI00383BE210
MARARVAAHRGVVVTPSADVGAPATRVLLVDDQELVRVGFRLILERSGLVVVGEAGDGAAGVAAAAELDPDVVLMDIRMPVMDGIEATRRILDADASRRVLALTTFDLDEIVFAAVRAGASGFLLKDVPPADLVHAVRVVARGEAMLAPALTARLLERFAAAPVPEAGVPPELDLTEREVEIVRLVARGRSNAEIGRALFLSESTVKTYVSRLLAKLGAHDRVQIAILAYETGLVRPGEGAD